MQAEGDERELQKGDKGVEGTPTTRKRRSKGKKKSNLVLRRRDKRGKPGDSDEKGKKLARQTPRVEAPQLSDSVNPISLGRRARQEIDATWRRFSQLGQFISPSTEVEVEKVGGQDNSAAIFDLVNIESLGYEIPQAVDTRVLVVGATGRIGRVLLNKLLLRGYTVRALVKDISDQVLDVIPPSVELIKGDVSDLNAVFEASRDCDKVICCAKARSNLLTEVTRVESTGVQNIVTSILHHKNEQANSAKSASPPGKTPRRNKITLFKFQGMRKRDHKPKSEKWGQWTAEGQDELGSATTKVSGKYNFNTPNVNVVMPGEKNNSFLFDGTNADFAEARSPISLPEGVSLRDCEGFVLNVLGEGKNFAVVLYTEDESGRHGYISKFSTVPSVYCTRRVAFNAFTRLTPDQPPLDLTKVTELGLRYRSAWNKRSDSGAEAEEQSKGRKGRRAKDSSSSFRLKMDWIKILPGGPEPDVVLISCSGNPEQTGGGEDQEARYLKPKKAGEAHLRNSGLGYTIIRPSQLMDVPGGREALFFDQGSRLKASISCADVADVCLRCLHSSEARNKTFDVSNEADVGSSEFELIAHVPDRNTDYLSAAVSSLEKNT